MVDKKSPWKLVALSMAEVLFRQRESGLRAYYKVVLSYLLNAQGLLQVKNMFLLDYGNLPDDLGDVV